MNNVNTSEEREFLMVFKNTHDAIQGEKVLSEKGISIIVVPTPTYITQSCGISLKFNENELQEIEQLILEERVKPKNIYIKEENNWKLYT